MKIGLASGLLLAVALLATAPGCARPLPAGASVNADNVKSMRAAFGTGKSTGGETAAASAEPTGWATFKGSFKVTGAPQPVPLTGVNKDTSVCAPGGKMPLTEVWRTDAAGNLRDVVVYLSSPFKAGDPKWEHESYLAKKDEVPEFDQKDCVFLSHVFAMRGSQTLKILNSDTVGHNTKIDGEGKAQSANVTVAANGSETYKPAGVSGKPMSVGCSIHPWMAAKIITVGSPLFAVSKPDGTFEIANVPAGVELEFKVWHEGLENVSGPITLNGKTAKLDRGKLKFKADPDATVELQFEGAAK